MRCGTSNALPIPLPAEKNTLVPRSVAILEVWPGTVSLTPVSYSSFSSYPMGRPPT